MYINIYTYIYIYISGMLGHIGAHTHTHTHTHGTCKKHKKHAENFSRRHVHADAQINKK